MAFTKYQAKFAAYELSRLAGPQSLERLSHSLFDSKVDLNPHQIEAALFALNNPLSKGVILADEVGLGKTIEAGLVISQLWAERKRKLMVVCPASLRRQWAAEMEEKFHLPTKILDAKGYKDDLNAKIADPFDQAKVLILSYPYAVKMRDKIARHQWDRVVFDEAHKLRNAHKNNNKTGQALKKAFPGSFKMLLTATPLQNSLVELFGLTSLIDGEIFGDLATFRRDYTRSGADLHGLKSRLKNFCKRTLRKEVQEYVNYTKRRAITQPFSPADEELEIYDQISAFLQREDTYALPEQHRHLTLLILRKLLASSSAAIGDTLGKMRDRLLRLQKGDREKESLLAELTFEEELEEDYLEEADSVEEEESPVYGAKVPDKLEREIQEVTAMIARSRAIQVDSKSRALLMALETGFREMARNGALKKAVIFTESRRTQEYLRDFLNTQGYEGKLVTFNGTNKDPDSELVYQLWIKDKANLEAVTGSRPIDMRSALIDHFKKGAEILIATEAAAEGINLQFCSLVINYDLPWNPQRVEQRIGRCHRYGQKFDVVVVNFLNERNHADKRVLELLTEKFKLFDGLFGASDSVLGQIESGLDFEKRILEIYQSCRSPEEIEKGFLQLQTELSNTIDQKLEATQSLLFEHFDQQIHELLKVRKQEANRILDRTSRLFWGLTQWILAKKARFEKTGFLFDLVASPLPGIQTGTYQLVHQAGQQLTVAHEYRLGHPLGQFVIEMGKATATPPTHLELDLTGHGAKLSLLEPHRGSRGFLLAQFVRLKSLDEEERVLLGGWLEDGSPLGAEEAEQVLSLGGKEKDQPLAELLNPSQETALAQTLLERFARESEDRNFGYYKEERQKLELWANERIEALDLELQEIAQELKELNKQTQASSNMAEETQVQEKISETTKRQLRLKRNLFTIQEQIIEERDDLIERLRKRMTQEIDHQRLFSFTWNLV